MVHLIYMYVHNPTYHTLGCNIFGPEIYCVAKGSSYVCLAMVKARGNVGALRSPPPVFSLYSSQPVVNNSVENQ